MFCRITAVLIGVGLVQLSMGQGGKFFEAKLIDIKDNWPIGTRPPCKRISAIFYLDCFNPVVCVFTDIGVSETDEVEYQFGFYGEQTACFKLEIKTSGVYRFTVTFPDGYDYAEEDAGLLDIKTRQAPPDTDPDAVLVPLIPFTSQMQDVYFEVATGGEIAYIYFYLHGLEVDTTFTLRNIAPFDDSAYPNAKPEAQDISNSGLVLHHARMGTVDNIPVDILTTAVPPTDLMLTRLSENTHLLCYQLFSFSATWFKPTWFFNKKLTGLKKETIYEFSLSNAFYLHFEMRQQFPLEELKSARFEEHSYQFRTTSSETLMAVFLTDLEDYKEGKEVNAITPTEVNWLTHQSEFLVPSGGFLTEVPFFGSNFIQLLFYFEPTLVSDGYSERLVTVGKPFTLLHMGHFQTTFSEDGIFYIHYCQETSKPRLYLKTGTEIDLLPDTCDVDQTYAVAFNSVKDDTLDFVIEGNTPAEIRFSFVAKSVHPAKPPETPRHISDNKSSFALILGISGGIVFVVLLSIGIYLA